MNAIEEVVRQISQLESLFEDGRISANEFCSNAVLILVHSGRECWKAAIAGLGADVVEELARYCSGEIGRDISSRIDVFLPHGDPGDGANRRNELASMYRALLNYVLEIRKGREV